jgi:hypothetical protein
LKNHSQKVATVREYANRLRLVPSSNAQPSRLSHLTLRDEYSFVSERELIDQAHAILKAAKLTTFLIGDKVMAVAVIKGLKPAPRKVIHGETYRLHR